MGGMRLWDFHVKDVAFGAMLCFLLGVMSVDLGAPNFFFPSVGILAFAICAIVFSFRKVWRVALVCLLFLVSGALYAHLVMERMAALPQVALNGTVSLTAVITSEPQRSEKSLLFSVAVKTPSRVSITVLTAPSNDFRYGDLVKLVGLVHAPDFPGGDALMNRPQVSVLGRNQGSWFLGRLIDFKKSALTHFRDFLSADDAGFLAATTIEEKNGIGSGLKQALVASGTSFLLSMYAWKMSIVIALVGGLLFGMVGRAWVGILITISVILFVLLAGSTASVFRAAIVIFAGLISRETGWRSDRRNILAFAVVGVTLWDPTAIVRDVAFMLAVLSVLGALYLAPALRHFFHVRDGGGMLGWKDHVFIGFAAQIATLPIVVRIFGDFPAIGFVSGFFVMLAMPITMIFGWVLAALSLAPRIFSLFAAQIGKVLLDYEIAVVYASASTGLRIALPFGSLLFVAAYYGALAFFCFLLRPNHEKK